MVNYHTMKRFYSLLAALLPLLMLVLPLSAQQNKPELALQIGHVAQVTALIPSPDGRLLISGAMDGTVKVWDANSGQLRLSLTQSEAGALPEPVLALAFSPENALVAATSTGVLRWWEISTGRKLKTLKVTEEEAKKGATAAAFSPDTKQIAYALLNRKIAFVNTTDGAVKITRGEHETNISTLAFSPDGQTLASGSEVHKEKTPSPDIAPRGGDVRLWDAVTGRLLHELSRAALGVNGLNWSADGKRLASAWESGHVLIWDTENLRQKTKITQRRGWHALGRNYGALSVAFSSDGEALIVGWRGGSQLWDLTADENGVSRRRRSGPPQIGRGGKSLLYDALWEVESDEPQTTAAFVGPRVALGGREGTVQFLNADTGALQATHSRLNPLGIVRLSPDGKTIAAAGAGGDIALWDATNGTLRRVLRGHDKWVRALAFSPDSQMLISGGFDRTLRFWDVKTATQRGASIQKTFPVNALAVSPDGKTLAAALAPGSVQVWKILNWQNAKIEEVRELLEPEGVVQTLVFSPDGSQLAAAMPGTMRPYPLTAAIGRGGRAGRVIVWDTTQWKARDEFVSGARSVTFSPDGGQIAVAAALLDETDEDNGIGDSVVPLATLSLAREPALKVSAPRTRANDIAVLPDDVYAVASRDGNIRLFNGNQIQTLSGHYGPVSSLTVSSDGKTLFSAGYDGTVRLWDNKTGRQRAMLMHLPADDKNLGSGEWLSVTPEGFYDASPGAARFIQWRVGADLFPVEAYEKNFRSADALKSALTGGIVNTPANFATGKAIPPQAQIVLPRAGQTVTGSPLAISIALTDDQNVKRVQLFANGRPVAEQDAATQAKALEIGAKPLEIGAKALEIGAKPLEIGAKSVPESHKLKWDVRLEAPLPPPDGAGLTLKALVTDADGLQGWDEIRVSRGEAGTGGALRVLTIGVSQYANPAFNLKYASSDATVFGALWPALEGKLFNKVVLKSLTDAQATSANVRAALNDLANSAEAGDVLAIFLSGHGIRKTENEFFFASHDVNLANINATTVPWTEFQNALASSKARRVVLFLDACHSGGALGNLKAGNESMAEPLVKSAGAVVFASSLGEQVSFELDDIKHGAFTQALIEGIGAGKADLDVGAGKDGIINVEELLTFLRARVPQLTGGAQLPSCPLLRDFGEPFPLTRVK